MPKRIRERDRMRLYSIAMPEQMMVRIRACAAHDDIAIRLWIREAIDVYLKFQERQMAAEQAEAAERARVSA